MNKRLRCKPIHSADKESVDTAVKPNGSRLKRVLKPVGLFLLLVFIVFWLYNAYVTITTVKITDVVGTSEEIFKLVEKDPVRKTVIVYEDISSTEENLFILVVVFNTDTSQVLVYHFPRNVYIKDSFSNKYVSIQSLTYAGDTFTYDGKYAYVIRQMSEQTGMTFDSYVWIGADTAKHFFHNSDNRGYTETEILKMFSRLSIPRLVTSYYKADTIADSLYSNMNFVEIYTYFQQIRGVVTSGKYKYINIGENNMTKKIVLGTGQKVSAIDLVAFDKSVEDSYSVLTCRNLEREHVKVEVYNGTNIPMYAGKVARQIHNSGCRVVRHSNAPKPYEKNYIYISNPSGYTTALVKILRIIDDPVIVEGRPDFLTTGDIVVILGVQEDEVF